MGFLVKLHSSNSWSANVRFGSKADICPLCPRKRTLIEQVGMSALSQKQTLALGLCDCLLLLTVAPTETA